MKCKLLKKLRKNYILYRKIDPRDNTYYYTVTDGDFNFSEFKDALEYYHNCMMSYLNRHYYFLWAKLQKKTEIQILP